MPTDKSAKKTASRGRKFDIESAKTILGKKLCILLGNKKRAEKSAIMGVSGESVRSYLAGETVPDARALKSLHCETGVDLNWLLNENDSTPEKEWPVLLDETTKITKNSDTSLVEEIADLNKRIEELTGERDRLVKHNQLLEDKLDMSEQAGRTGKGKLADGA